MAERTHLTAATTAPSSTAERNAGERNAEEIRKDIAARRETITETVDRISDRFQETFDWRSYVAQYPLAALGVAAGVGFVLSGWFKPRRTPAQRMKAALADSIEDITTRLRNQLEDVSPRKPALSRTVKAAATGAITKAVADYLKHRLSGYAGQYYGQYQEADMEPESPDNADWIRSSRPGEQRANFEPHY